MLALALTCLKPLAELYNFPTDALSEKVVIVAKLLRANEQIHARKVRLIDDVGEQLGVLALEDALALATEKELDLVEVAPQANPVVCRLMDFGRHSYQEKKKRNEARAKQHNVMTKMVKFRPNTFKGDYEVKANKIRHFLEQGDKVKAVMQFRGREIIHAQNGYAVFKRLAEELSDCCTPDAEPTTEGRFIHMILAPLPARLRAKANGKIQGTATKPAVSDTADGD